MFFCSVSRANTCENNKKMPIINNCEYKNECKEKQAKNTDYQEKYNEKSQNLCQEFEIEDDEYFTYNQCYFDKSYRNTKEQLYLTPKQEECLDKAYQN